jgi:hypothetical protein
MKGEFSKFNTDAVNVFGQTAIKDWKKILSQF